MNIWDIVDSALLEEEKASQAERGQKDHWWPSEALGCRRRSYYDWTLPKGSGRPMDLKGLYRTKAGNVLHEWFFQKIAAYYAKQEGVIVEEEIKSLTEIDGLKSPASGRQDVRITFPDGRSIVVIDLKSTFGQNIRSIKQQGWQGLKPHYLGQMICYLAWGDCDEVILAFLGRDDQYRIQFSLTLKDEWLYIDGHKTHYAVSSVVDRWQSVERSIEADQLPERDFMVAIRDGKIVAKFQRQKVDYKSDFQCLYCPHQDRCWGPELEKYETGTNREMYPGSDQQAAC